MRNVCLIVEMRDTVKKSVVNESAAILEDLILLHRNQQIKGSIMRYV